MRLRAGLCLPVTEYGHDVRAIEAFVTGADPRDMGDATTVMGELDVLLVLLATAAAAMADDTHLARCGLYAFDPGMAFCRQSLTPVGWYGVEMIFKLQGQMAWFF